MLVRPLSGHIPFLSKRAAITARGRRFSKDTCLSTVFRQAIGSRGCQNPGVITQDRATLDRLWEMVRRTEHAAGVDSESAKIMREIFEDRVRRSQPLDAAKNRDERSTAGT